MFQVTALYNHPEDAEAFDKYYDTVHAPLAKTFPGLQRFTVCHPAPDQDGNAPTYHLIAVLEFADAAAFGAAAGSPEGEAIMADVPKFAGAGVTILTGESHEA